MHMMTCQILVLGQNTRGVTPTPSGVLHSSALAPQPALPLSPSARPDPK